MSLASRPVVIQQRIRPRSPLSGVNSLCETRFIVPPQSPALAATLLAPSVLTLSVVFNVLRIIFGVVIRADAITAF